MKNIYLLILTSLLLTSNKAYSQATVAPGNTSITPALDYLGWDITPGNPDLNVKHERNLPIRFYTNAGNGAFNNQRMLIDSTLGFIGMGLNFNTPLSILHINGTNNSTGEVFRTDGATGNDQFWRMYRAGGLYGTLYNLAGARHSFNATLQKIFL